MARDITQLHPRLQKIIPKLIEECNKQGLKIGIGECFRTVEEQDKLYSYGRTDKSRGIVTNAKGSNYSSHHQWGTAFDFYRNDGTGAYNESGRFFERVGAIGMNLGLEWGGNWTSIVDRPHFQLPDWGSTTTLLKKLYSTPERFIATWVTNTSAKTAKATGDTYTVKSGDTLWGIANKHNITVDRLRALNGLNSDLIHVGDKLVINEIKASTGGTGDVYTVKRGDTLWQIAANNNTTVVELKALNGLTSNIIHVGDKLIIRDEKPSQVGSSDDWIARLQRTIGAKVDNIAGQETLSKTPTIKHGSRGEVVKLVQERLADKYNISIGKYGADGVCGASTVNAIKEFQSKYAGLKIPDGVFTARGLSWETILGLNNKTDTGVKGTVTASKLNVRRDAGTKHPVVNQLSKGDTVNILDSKQNGSTTWYKVGTNQWVSSKHIETNSTSTPTPKVIPAPKPNTQGSVLVVTPKTSIKQIQNYLKQSGHTIRFSQGVYNITQPLELYSDTKIHLDGATLIRKNAKQLFINYLNPNKSYDYNATKNVTFYGNGTLKGNGSTKTCSTISLMHCDNIVFDGITFASTYHSHAVDIAGCSNVTFKNVTFKDRIDNSGKEYKEEINVDFSYYGGYPYYSREAKCYNANHCKNITFDKCTFSNINTCIGSHTETSSLKKHKNITIKNCKATGLGKGVFVNLLNTTDSVIENNDISGFKRGIMIDALRQFYHVNGLRDITAPRGKTACEDIVINNNKIYNAKGTVKASGIYIVSQSHISHKNIKVTNNTFDINNKNAVSDIYVGDAEDVIVSGNKTKLIIRVNNATTKNVNVK